MDETTLDRLVRGVAKARIRGRAARVTTPDDLIEAYRWVYDRYLEAGLIGKSSIGLRVRTWEHDAAVRTLVWREDQGSVQGVLSLIVDSALGLPCDHVAPGMTKALREVGPLGEASNLCVGDALHPRARMRVMLDLVVAAYWEAVEAGLAVVCAAVSPGHARMLEELCGFRKYGAVCVYPPDPQLTGSGSHDGPPDLVQPVAMVVQSRRARMVSLRRVLNE